MRERPILFSGPMVHAILDGRKTQTRRIIKPQPPVPYLRHRIGSYSGLPRPVWYWGRFASREAAYKWEEAGRPDDPAFPEGPWEDVFWPGEDSDGFTGNVYGPGGLACPYGAGPNPFRDEGDRLWVKEAWQAWDRTSHEYDEWEPWSLERRGGLSFVEYHAEHGPPDSIEYRATSQSSGPWNPSMFMPRWASRITLEVTGVRVERLQDISEADAEAEGIEDHPDLPDSHWRDYLTGGMTRDALYAFETLWKSINGPGSWDANPWVWVVEFRRIGAEATNV